MKLVTRFWNQLYKLVKRKVDENSQEFSSNDIDPVTGASNFTKFKRDVNQIFEMYPKEKFVLFYSDIKNFRYINDVYGFETGNKILKRFSDICLAGNKLAFARINADNFISIERYQEEDQIIEQCKKRINCVSDVSGIVEGMSTITVYVGAYCTDEVQGNMSIDAMIDRANIARRQQKENRLSGCLLYNEKFRLEMLDEQKMENRMHEALENQEFIVYLQPKFNIEKNEIAAAEALVRWNDPKNGLIPPAKFIALFEKNGFIKKLDTYVFGETCRLIRKWLDEGFLALPISVNVSKVQLNNPTFLTDYIELKERYHVPDTLIEIEFTESMLFDNSERMAEVLKFFKEHGFKSSIDDFGSGYSSLNLLKDLPADILKLDKVFFDENEYKEREKVIIKNVISMAKELSMQTVAEGVESMEQVEFLRLVKCEMVQGYVFDKPLPINQFEEKYIRPKKNPEA